MSKPMPRNTKPTPAPARAGLRPVAPQPTRAPAPRKTKEDIEAEAVEADMDEDTEYEESEPIVPEVEEELEEAPEEVEDVPEPAPAPRAVRPAARPAPAPAPKAAPKAAPAPKATKEVAVRKTSQVAMAEASAPSAAIKGDIVLPRLLLMQGSSQLVKDRKAQVGDIVRSTSGERLGGSNGPDKAADPVDVIPLALSQSWTIMSGDGKTFLGVEPRTPANDSLPWEFVDEEGKFGEPGDQVKRVKTIDAIVMVANDIAHVASGDVAVDEDGIPLDIDSSLVLPHGVSFKSTGFTAGKNISTFFAKVENLQKTHPLTRPYHFTLPLSCYTDSDADNEWHVFDIGPAKRTQSNLVQEAARWFETVSSKRVVLQDENEAESQASDQAEPAAPRAPAPTAKKNRQPLA